MGGEKAKGAERERDGRGGGRTERIEDHAKHGAGAVREDVQRVECVEAENTQCRRDQVTVCFLSNKDVLACQCQFRRAWMYLGEGLKEGLGERGLMGCDAERKPTIRGKLGVHDWRLHHY